MRTQDLQRLITPKSHPLKTEIKKCKLRLWQVSALLDGALNEGKLSRYLNGIDIMPKEIEDNISKALRELKSFNGK